MQCHVSLASSAAVVRTFDNALLHTRRSCAPKVSHVYGHTPRLSFLTLCYVFPKGTDWLLIWRDGTTPSRPADLVHESTCPDRDSILYFSDGATRENERENKAKQPEMQKISIELSLAASHKVATSFRIKYARIFSSTVRDHRICKMGNRP